MVLPFKMNSLKSVILIVFNLLIASVVYSQQYGLIIADNVNVREGASSKSKVVAKIKSEMTFVVIDDYTMQGETIKYGNTDMNFPWYHIKGDSLKNGWIYGAYIILFNSADSVQTCISQNKDFRQKCPGKYTFNDKSEYFGTYYDLEFFSDGKVKIHSNCVEGDHILDESGEGRYYLNTSTSALNVYGNMTGEFAPDFYTWEEYFTMANGHKPTKKELDAYMKEKSTYKSRCSFSIPLEKLDEMLIPSK